MVKEELGRKDKEERIIRGEEGNGEKNERRMVIKFLNQSFLSPNEKRDFVIEFLPLFNQKKRLVSFQREKNLRKKELFLSHYISISRSFLGHCVSTLRVTFDLPHSSPQDTISVVR